MCLQVLCFGQETTRPEEDPTSGWLPGHVPMLTRVPQLGLMLSCHLLETLNSFLNKKPDFYFAQGPASYVVGPSPLPSGRTASSYPTTVDGPSFLPSPSPSPSPSLHRIGYLLVNEKPGLTRLPTTPFTQTSGYSHSPSLHSISNCLKEVPPKPNSLSVVTCSWPLTTFQKRIPVEHALPGGSCLLLRRGWGLGTGPGDGRDRQEQTDSYPNDKEPQSKLGRAPPLPSPVPPGLGSQIHPALPHQRKWRLLSQPNPRTVATTPTGPSHHIKDTAPPSALHPLPPQLPRLFPREPRL